MTPYLKADTEVFSVERYDQTLPFYLKRTVTLVNYVDEFNLGQEAEPHKWIPTNEAFALRWNAAPNALGITNIKTYQKLQESGLPMTMIYNDPRRIVFKKP